MRLAGISKIRQRIAILGMLVLGTGWAAENPSAPQRPSVTGEVLEVKDVDAYTYLRLKTAQGETWAAVSKSPVKKGAKVTIENATFITNFESKTLKKTFDKIVFGSLAGSGGGATATAGGGSSDMGDPHAGMARPADISDVKVPKASGADARTVAEIVTGRAKLKDKPVAVRGKVVKFTAGVMGKNWVHLRDGSGSAAEKTNDVLVTTKDTTKVDDVVVAKGVVHTDVDLGSGYKYEVLVENATLQK
jgi:hypothetical protein